VGRGTDAGVILALVECWAKDGVSETAVGRSDGQALWTGEAGGLYKTVTAAGDETAGELEENAEKRPARGLQSNKAMLGLGGSDGGSLRH
jgi:hypothetical protein